MVSKSFQTRRELLGLSDRVVDAIDNRYAATLRFRDAPRAESRSFVRHLGPKHHFQKVMIVSGDCESEARYLAEQVGITEIYAQKSPEEKLAIVRILGSQPVISFSVLPESQ